MNRGIYQRYAGLLQEVHGKRNKKQILHFQNNMDSQLAALYIAESGISTIRLSVEKTNIINIFYYK